jgi:pSer/pThr/pTyr-binding forkhead associated (FHA) protein
VGVKDEMIRMCDLDSQSGTYIENERVDVADLAHLSELRVGSSLLLVTVLPAQEVPTKE